LITGWDLGKGPCGPACSKDSVGNIISSSALMGTTTVLRTMNGTNAPINVSITEHVLAVSDTEVWEQELATFKVDLNKIEEKIRLVCFIHKKVSRYNMLILFFCMLPCLN